MRVTKSFKLVMGIMFILIHGSAVSEIKNDRCTAGYVLLGGLCHSYESLELTEGDTFNPYDQAEELTPELAVMIINLLPDEIIRFIDSYLGSHVSFMSPDELLKWDLSIRDYLAYLSYIPVQLDVSKVPEIFILDQTPGRCGSGGCSGFILDLDSSATGDVLGNVFFTGSVLKPLIGPAPPPESGYYDFAVVGDEGITKYQFDSVKKRY